MAGRVRARGCRGTALTTGVRSRETQPTPLVAGKILGISHATAQDQSVVGPHVLGGTQSLSRPHLQSSRLGMVGEEKASSNVAIQSQLAWVAAAAMTASGIRRDDERSVQVKPATT